MQLLKTPRVVVLLSIFPLITFALPIFHAPDAAVAQPAQPAIFVCHNIAVNPPNTFPAVSSFTMDPDGTVHYVGNYATNNNPQAISVSPNGRFLAVTHGTASTTTEDLIVYRIESDASLTMWAVYATPDSPLDVEWISNDVVACTETKTSGTNRVHVYRLAENNPVATRLTLIDSETSGLFTDYLQRHPSGNYLYAADSNLSGSSLHIRVFAVNPDKTLEFVTDMNTPSYALDMAVTHSGNRLYSAGGIGSLGGGSTHRVHGFDINPVDGTLAFLAGSPFESPGDSPAHVATTGDDRFLLVGHGGDGDVRSFLISPEDGFLTDTNFLVSIGSQGDIGAITTLGRFLIATRRYSSTGNPSGLLVYHVNNNGDFVNVGGNIDTHGTASDAIAAWAPAAPAAGGDINNDGAVNQLDAAALVAVLMGTPQDPGHVARSELNGDGQVNGRDISAWIRFLLNPPVAPGACCGADLTCFIQTQVECAFESGATWAGPGTTCAQCGSPPPIISDVFPDAPTYCNSPGTLANLTVVGSNFSPQATVSLTLTGQTPLVPAFVNIPSTDTILVGFDLSGVAPGLWRVSVTNPDNQTAASPVTHPVQICP